MLNNLWSLQNGLAIWIQLWSQSSKEERKRFVKVHKILLAGEPLEKSGISVVPTHALFSPVDTQQN